MWRLPTTRVDIHRSASITSADGDEADPVDDDSTKINTTPVPASIIEQSKTRMRRDSDTPMTVRSITGGLPDGTDVLPGDRLHDLNATSNAWYLVDSTDQAQRPGFVPPQDIRCDLRRLTI